MCGLMDLRTYRKSKKLTLAKLGEQLGVTAVTVHRYETGIRKPAWDILEKIVVRTEKERQSRSEFVDRPAALDRFFHIGKTGGQRER